MSTTLSITLRGARYTATIDDDATLVRDAAGALVGCVWTDTKVDAELFSACLPTDLPAALELVRRLVAAEEAQALAEGETALRDARGRRLAAATWTFAARIHAHRAADCRRALAALAVAIGVLA